MNRFSPLSWFRRTPNENTAKTLVVAVGVSLACSVIVSTAVVLLRPLHEANRLHEQRARFGDLVTLLERIMPGGAAGITSHVVNLADGRLVSGLNPEAFDVAAAARDPARSVALSRDQDIAGLKRRASRAVVYLVRSSGSLGMIILPVSGRGYGGIIHGYLGLSGDTNTVIGLTFFEHAETPGLGGQIEGPAWRAQWRGKQVWDNEGGPALAIATGKVTSERPGARHQVDALTGATWTSQGVTNMLRFWLGDMGYGPLLRRIREGDLR